MGLACGVATYTWWGIFPIYLKLTMFATPMAVLCHRIAWSAPMLALFIVAVGRMRDVRSVLHRRELAWLGLTSLLIAVNWLAFIVGIDSGRITDVSLGYFLAPLCMVCLGMLVLGERMRRLQWLAVLLAAAGVTAAIVLAERTPWLGLAVAGSFASYALVRKRIAVPSLAGLLVETLWLFPLAIVGLTVFRALPESGSLPIWKLMLLPGLGVVTAAPLVLFGIAAPRLKLTTIGLLQFIAPSLQLLMAVMFGEAISPGKWCAFSLVWCGLLVYTTDSFLTERTRRQIAKGTAGLSSEPALEPLPR